MASESSGLLWGVARRDKYAEQLSFSRWWRPRVERRFYDFVRLDREQMEDSKMRATVKVPAKAKHQFTSIPWGNFGKGGRVGRRVARFQR